MDELTYEGEKLTASEATELALKAEFDPKAKELLLKSFMGYIDKYANIIKGTISLDTENRDTIQFRQLFISNANLSFYSPARLTDHLKSIFFMVDVEDIKHDLITDFLHAVNKFTPEKAKGGFLSYVVQYIRWKAKDKIVAAMSQPLHNTNWSITPMRGTPETYYDAINPIDLPHFQKIEEPTLYEGLSEMTLDWVNNCKDPLFRDLSRYSRYLLYLRYKCGQTFDDMAATLRRSPRTVSDQFKRTILRLRLMVHRDGALDDLTLLEELEESDDD